MQKTRFLLSEREIPKRWYNILSDMPKLPPPPLDPVTHKPIDLKNLERIFSANLVEQEIETRSWIDIPEEVIEKLLLWRPTPLCRAVNFEKALDVPVKIFYKNESLSPAGSHKVNSAIAQAYYNKVFGIKRLTTETGAGQWGSALSFASQIFGIALKVYMVKVSYQQKPFRKTMMKLWGAECVPSPSPDTETGRKIISEDPNNPGSLGIAISEAVEDALSNENTRYSLGSVLNFVCLHQTIIGLEAVKQLKMAGVYPDLVVGCVGGGSNFAGIAAPFVKDKINGKNVDILGVEPQACPTMTRAPYVYDYGDNAKKTPLMAMYSLGHNFMPPPVHAGGLRYHGLSPIVSKLLADNVIRASSIPQLECYKYAKLWAQTEGLIPAPESSHAIAAAAKEALRAKEEGKEKNILFCLSGHGLMDLNGYDAFLDGKLSDLSVNEEDMQKSLELIKNFPKP